MESSADHLWLQSKALPLTSCPWRLHSQRCHTCHSHKGSEVANRQSLVLTKPDVHEYMLPACIILSQLLKELSSNLLIKTWLDRKLKYWVFPTESIGDFCYKAADNELLWDAANVCLCCDTKVGLSGYSKDGSFHTYWKSDSDSLWKNISISHLGCPQNSSRSMGPTELSSLSSQWEDTVWHSS